MTFDEYGRREVARRLRERAPETYVGLYEAVMGRQVAPDSRWGDDARELCERLAGLIEPREPRPGKFRVGERCRVAVDFPCGAQLHAGDEVEVLDVGRHGVLVSSPGGQCGYVTRGQLTRELPDSWERWREDIEADALGYAQDAYHGRKASIDFDGYTRRARALAERGQ